MKKFFDAIDYWMAPVWVLALFGLTSFGWGWLAQFTAAYAAWTLIEYWLHRSVFHAHWSRAIWRGHMDHHRNPHDIQNLRLLTPVLIVGVVVVALMWREVTPIIQGLVAGYWGYLMIHWALHEFEFRGDEWWMAGRYLRYLQLRHDRHHHKNARTWYGLHTMLWDHVFGTAEPVYAINDREYEEVRAAAPAAPREHEEWFCTYSGHSKSMIQAWGGCTHQGPCPMDIRAAAPAAPDRYDRLSRPLPAPRGRLRPPRWNDK